MKVIGVVKQPAMPPMDDRNVINRFSSSFFMRLLLPGDDQRENREYASLLSPLRQPPGCGLPDREISSFYKTTCACVVNLRVE